MLRSVYSDPTAVIQTTTHLVSQCQLQFQCNASTTDLHEYHLVLLESNETDASVLSHKFIQESDEQTRLVTYQLPCNEETINEGYYLQCVIFSANGAWVTAKDWKWDTIECNCNREKKLYKRSSSERMLEKENKTIYYVAVPVSVVVILLLLVLITTILGCCCLFIRKKSHSPR